MNGRFLSVPKYSIVLHQIVYHMINRNITFDHFKFKITCSGEL